MKRFLPALLLAVTLCSVNSYAVYTEFRYVNTGAGFDLGLVLPDRGLNPTFGWGGHLGFNFSLGDIGDLQIRPGLQFWISGDDNDYYRGFNFDEFTVFEMAVNGDFRYYFPLPDRIRVRPYVGNGLAIITTVESWDYDDPYEDLDDSDTEIGTGFNFQTGADFLFSNTILGNAEMKIKAGKYDTFKLLFGMTFLFGGR